LVVEVWSTGSTVLTHRQHCPCDHEHKEEEFKGYSNPRSYSYLWIYLITFRVDDQGEPVSSGGDYARVRPRSLHRLLDQGELTYGPSLKRNCKGTEGLHFSFDFAGSAHTVTSAPSDGEQLRANTRQNMVALNNIPACRPGNNWRLVQLLGMLTPSPPQISTILRGQGLPLFSRQLACPTVCICDFSDVRQVLLTFLPLGNQRPQAVRKLWRGLRGSRQGCLTLQVSFP
jgi:hypothetical protein